MMGNYAAVAWAGLCPSDLICKRSRGIYKMSAVGQLRATCVAQISLRRRPSRQIYSQAIVAPAR